MLKEQVLLYPVTRQTVLLFALACCLWPGTVARARAQENLPRSAEWTRQAWIALKDKNPHQAIQLTERVISDFRASARAKQSEIAELIKKREQPPPIGAVTHDAFDRVVDNGPINDVGTAYLIRGKAFRALHDRTSALMAFRAGRELTYARAWDPGPGKTNGWNKDGWLWSPAQAADEEISSLVNWGEIIAYGELAWQENNLASPAFQSPVTLDNTEVRLLYGSRSLAPGFRPYITLRPAWSSRNISVESTLTYGIGIENRPFTRWRALSAQPELEWLTRARLYTEYLGQGFFRGANPHFNPRQNFVAGFDLWRQYGFEDPDRPDNNDPIWGELFVGGAFHTTNFYIRNYNAVRFGFNTRVGAKLGSRKLPLLPYIDLDLNSASRYADQFFNNRLIGAIGVRTELRFGKEGRVWIFGEYRGILAYLKDSPLAALQVPRSEGRVGVTFQLSRY